MEEDKQTFGLTKNINKAAAVRNMCQTPGFKVLEDLFEERVKKATEAILNPSTTNDQAIEIRNRVAIWVEIKKALKQIQRTGELSKRALDNLEVNNSSPDKQEDKETN